MRKFEDMPFRISLNEDRATNNLIKKVYTIFCLMAFETASALQFT